MRALFVWILLVAAAVSSAQVVYVDADAVGANNGSSWADAYTDLQDALANVSAGEEIWVAEGAYTPSKTGDVAKSFRLVAQIGLFGGFAGNETARGQRNWTQHPTILSGDLGRDDVYGAGAWYIGWNIHTPNSQHVVVAENLVAGAVIDGFTLAQAHGSYGGGLLALNSTLTVANCTFWRNLAGFNSGGGAYVLDSNATFADCKFVQNWCHLGSGGGIHADGTTTLTVARSLFNENHCTGDASSGNGGGLNLYNTGPTRVEDCVFQDNRALPFGSQAQGYGTYGGAIHNLRSALTADRCRFLRNHTMQGGGVFSWTSFSVFDSEFVANRADSYNSGSGSVGGVGGGVCAYNFSTLNVTLVGCTLVSNFAHETGGIWLRPTNSVVSTCILWDNSDQNGRYSQSQIAGTRASYCDIQNLWVTIPGEDPIDPAKFPHCFDYDPRFVNPLGDYQLRPDSPCLDAGDKGAFPGAGPYYDVRRKPRFVNDPAPDTGAGTPPLPDMGCYERWKVPVGGGGIREVPPNDVYRVPPPGA